VSQSLNPICILHVVYDMDTVVLYASDEEQITQLAPKRHKTGSDKRIELSSLLARKCRCNRQTCFSRMLGRETAVHGVRKHFDCLESHEKDHRLGFRCLVELFNLVFICSFPVIFLFCLTWCLICFVISVSYTNKESYVRAAFGFDGTAQVVLTASALEPLDDDNELFGVSDDEVFMSNSDDAQTCTNNSGMLFASDDEENDQLLAKRSYSKRRTGPVSFLGSEVCQSAYERLLGIGTGTIQQLRKGKPAFTNNNRLAQPKHPTFGFIMDYGRKWVTVVMFLWFIYHSCAETLPTTFHMPRTANEAPFLRGQDVSDYALRVVNKFMNGLNTYCNDPDVVNMGPGTFCGPKRHLQHTTRTDLFWEYRAYCNAVPTEAAGYGLFLKVVNKVLKPGTRNSHLGLRKTSEHAQCDTCFQLKRAIRVAVGQEAKQEAYRKYSSHILSQWLDRQLYWSFRSMSQGYFDQCRRMGSRQISYNHQNSIRFRMACKIITLWPVGFRLFLEYVVVSAVRVLVTVSKIVMYNNKHIHHAAFQQ
jgi:hypothetical protein